MMIPGLDGHLVHGSFLEAEIRPIAGTQPLEVARRNLAEAGRACRDLGPAAAIRAVLETAAIPLVRLLGFDDPSDRHNADAAVVTTLRGGRDPIALMVVAWGTPYDPLWRAAKSGRYAEQAVERHRGEGEADHPKHDRKQHQAGMAVSI